jgi:hypothetical protein
VRIPVRQPIVAVPLAAGALVLAALGAAFGGSWTLQERHYGSWHWQLSGATPQPEPPPTAVPSLPPSHGSSSAGGVHLDPRWFLGALVVLAAAAIGYGLWRLWARYRRTAGPAEPRQAGADGAAADVEQVPELPPLLRGVDSARSSLQRIAAPDDAIIAAWLAVEEAAEQSGVQRHPAQTPTEFTVAVLSRTSADPAAIHSLLSLYHLARFSARPASPTDVAAADECLRALRRSWSDEPMAARA